MSHGDYLRAFRREHNLTKGELALRLRSKLRTVEDWEAERRTPPDMLPLALAAVSLEAGPWIPSTRIDKTTTRDELKSSIAWLFCKEAQARAVDFEDAFSRCVPEAALPSEALLFAYLLNVSDGYNTVEPYEDWTEKTRANNAPAMSFKPNLDGITPTIAIESKWESECRTLAIFVESRRPGDRSPEKLRVENALVARGIRVLSFVESEIFNDPEDCRLRVELVLSNLTEDCLVELGHIPRRVRSAE